MKEVLIINGSGGVGKDTFVNLLSWFATVKHYSIAEIPKSIAKSVGWKGDKTEKDRKFLSDLKILVDDYNDANFNKMHICYKNFMQSDTEILCIDMREEKDIERAKKMFNARTVLVVRDNVRHIVSNIADKNVFNMKYDFYIDNNSSLDVLKQKARKFVRQLRNEYNTYKNVVYVSHPFGGDESNKKEVEEIIKELQKQNPKTLYISPINAFNYNYFELPYEEGIEQCLWLLSQCDCMYVCGDYENSKGCGIEIEYCKNSGIEVFYEKDINPESRGDNT